MIYTIQISYITGDSFSIYPTTNIIGLCWSNLNKAQEAIKEIYTHEKYYNNISYYKYNQLTEQEKIEFSNIIRNNNKYTLIIKDDNDNDYKISVFWRGYFESLQSADIIELSTTQDIQ